MESKKKTVLTTVIALLLILIAVAGSYAYYMVAINNDDAVSVNITAKDLGITYSDGAEIVREGILPGTTIVKTVTVTNTSTAAITFDLQLIDVLNELDNQDELKLHYEIEATSTVSPDVNYPSATTTIINDYELAVDEAVTVKVYVEYLNTNSSQNIDMDKTITGTLNITDVKEA